MNSLLSSASLRNPARPRWVCKVLVRPLLVMLANISLNPAPRSSQHITSSYLVWYNNKRGLVMCLLYIKYFVFKLKKIKDVGPIVLHNYVGTNVPVCVGILAVYSYLSWGYYRE